MAQRDLALRIGARLVHAGLTVPAATIDQLTAYLELLARWNERINLTAFALTAPTDDALDRLLVEPLVAARRILESDQLLIDIGSGGGSPAIPLRIAASWLRVVLVESKARKCAFLREAVRQLELPGVEVENRRLEELAGRLDLHGAADVVTIRAVRADAMLWTTVRSVLKPGGRVFWFATPEVLAAGQVPSALTVEAAEVLSGSDDSRLFVLKNSQ